MTHVVVGLEIGQLRIELRCEGIKVPEIVISLGNPRTGSFNPVLAKADSGEHEVLPFLLGESSNFQQSPTTSDSGKPSKQATKPLSSNNYNDNDNIDNNDQASMIEVLSPAPVSATLISQIRAGCSKYPPELCEEGVGGVYFFRNTEGDKVAVFKPNDEEANAPNNPKGSDFDGSYRGIKEGTVAGEGAVHECAAYLLDRDHFSSVPFTTLARCTSSAFFDESKSSDVLKTKIGSLQQYIPHTTSCEDIGASLFPKNEVHKIGILDLRTLNTDRHLGNILATKTPAGYELTPIDHGLCLPSSFSDGLFEWITWPQAKQPFDAHVLQYIDELDVEEDVRLLKSKLPIRDESLRTLRVCTMLLKQAAKQGFTLYEIASMMCRMNPSTPCMLEKLVQQVEVDTGVSDGVQFYEALQQQFTSMLDNRKP
jgi:hypothetical protein